MVWGPTTGSPGPRISSDLAATVLAGGQQAITSMGMGISLLLVARRVVVGSASVGDVPMVQGAGKQKLS